MAKCCIEGCNNPVQCPSTGTCKSCYASILNWTKRSRSDIERRAKNLGKFSSRMQTLVPVSLVNTINPPKIKLKGIPGKIKIRTKPTIKNDKHKRKIA